MADSKNSGDGASRSKIDKMSSEVGIETPIKNRYNLNHHFRLSSLSASTTRSQGASSWIPIGRR